MDNKGMANACTFESPIWGTRRSSCSPKPPVFTFEVHQLAEPIDCSRFPKHPTWEVLKSGLSDQVDASWSYATRINDDSVERGRRLEEEAIEREERHQNRFEVEISRITDYILRWTLLTLFAGRK